MAIAKPIFPAERNYSQMTEEDLNIGYLGYSDVTKEILDALSLDPDLTMSFVESVEEEYGRGVSYPEYEPSIEIESINSPKAIEAMEDHDIDILLVMGWPELLHEEALNVPNIGSVGRHLSLLPERRGRARPVHRRGPRGGRCREPRALGPPLRTPAVRSDASSEESASAQYVISPYSIRIQTVYRAATGYTLRV
jgi:hypothetical protein